MTRKEWFNNQTLEVQEQFINNCDTLNPIKFFDFWINDTTNYTSGINGAFIFAMSKEGADYWGDINEKAKKQIK